MVTSKNILTYNESERAKQDFFPQTLLNGFYTDTVSVTTYVAVFIFIPSKSIF